MKSFNSLNELYSKFPWKSPSKFIPIATKYGFHAADARNFLKNNVEHDVIPKKPVGITMPASTRG